MIAHKHITKIVSVIMVLAVCLCLCATAFSEKIKASTNSSSISREYESKLFETSEPITVNIIMESNDWSDMLSNAISEEYKECNVEINGTTFYRVGIRPKGNTSLSSIVSDPTSDRYSFKLEFDKYVDGQTCFGLDKLVLNNNYADATNMKEALIYDMFKYVGADASLCNYAKISVNGEYRGIYLALEAVEDSFLLRNYGLQSGMLYKPENMGVGGGQGGKGEENMSPPENRNEAETQKSEQETETTASVSTDSNSGSSEESTDSSEKSLPNENGNPPEMKGGFSSGGNGADLNYTDDNIESYSTIWDGEVTKSKKADRKRVVTALKNISNGTDLEKYMDIDNLVKYMAVHVFSVNDDSLSGTMAHNYYLYESGGKLNLIPWDYNLSFGGMGGKGNATSVVNDAIDNAFSATDFFDTLTANEEYNSMYYENLKKVTEYINGGEFEKFYNQTRSQIDELVKTDPNAFYSYDEYTAAAEALYKLVKLRGESIEKQLSGAIPSTAELQKNSDALVDASEINLSVLGSMGGNKGGFDFQKLNLENEESDSSSSAKGSAAESESSAQNDAPNTAFQNGTPPEMPGGERPAGEMPNGDFSGESMPSMNADSSSVSTSESESKAQSNQSESKNSAESSSESEKTSQEQNENAANGRPGNDFQNKGGQMNFPGNVQNDSSSPNGRNLAVFGVYLLIMIIFLAFAALYKRRPGKG